MADNLSPDEIRKDLEKQIADLKKEIASISKTLANRGADAYQDARQAAGQAYDRAKDQASGSLKQAKQQAHVVTDTLRENPGTAATVLSSAGIIGFMIGLAVGIMATKDSSRW